MPVRERGRVARRVQQPGDAVVDELDETRRAPPPTVGTPAAIASTTTRPNASSHVDGATTATDVGA